MTKHTLRCDEKCHTFYNSRQAMHNSVSWNSRYRKIMTHTNIIINHFIQSIKSMFEILKSPLNGTGTKR